MCSQNKINAIVPAIPVIRSQGKEGGVVWNLLELIGRVENYRPRVLLDPLPYLTHCVVEDHNTHIHVYMYMYM